MRLCGRQESPKLMILIEMICTLLSSDACLKSIDEVKKQCNQFSFFLVFFVKISEAILSIFSVLFGDLTGGTRNEASM